MAQGDGQIGNPVLSQRSFPPLGGVESEFTISLRTGAQMKQSSVARAVYLAIIVFTLVLLSFLAGCGALSGHGGGGGKNLNPPVTGLTAAAGNAQITLNWNAYPGATSYNVARSTTSGGECSAGCNYLNPLNPSTTASYTDVGLTNGTTYYYVVNANYSGGFSGLSNEASATPSGPSSSVAVTVDVFSNSHTMGLIYGGAFPSNTSMHPNILIPVRWGGNGSSTYNWQLDTYNAASDNFFEDLTFCGVGGAATNSPCTDSDSTKFIQDVSFAVMTMPMLPWVAQASESNGNGHWSFSVARDGPQCHTDPQNSDAGDGIALTSNCDTQPTYLTASTTDINDTYVPLLDDHSQSCPSQNCVYRDDWINALVSAAGTGIINWEMDNEIDMWGTTHHDIHPNPSGYDEMADTFLTQATKLKATDPQGVVYGPVSCCWWLYWNGANANDKPAHAGIDFLPWWLNQIYWQDQISGSRSLDMFDIHALPDATTTDSNGNPLSKSQLQSLAASIYRDYWDPTFVSPSATINQNATSIQPNPTIPFRIPRLRALINSIYPGTPLVVTEWNAAFAGESDFSTALGDADAYGLMGRERVTLATRWMAPNPANPNYLAFMLYANYNNGSYGSATDFGGNSVSAVHNADPNLFSSYATVGAFGSAPLQIMVINKDPQKSAQLQFTLSNFNATTFQTYRLTSASPTAIIASDLQPWSSAQSVAPYSVTLFIIWGSSTSTPAASWDLTPDTIMVPAGGTATLQASGVSPGNNSLFHVTLNSAVFDAYEGAPACGGSIVLTNPTINNSQLATLTVNAGNTPGFCHFTVSGTDNSGVAQTQGGWIVVGNPPASLTITGGNNQTGMHATALPVALSVNLAPGSSGGANPAGGAGIFFSTSAGTLANGSNTGSKVLATTDASGSASVTLTLPSSAQSVTVTAEGPYGLGHPTVTFNETSQ